MKAPKKSFGIFKTYRQLIHKLFNDSAWQSFISKEQIPEKLSDEMYHQVLEHILAAKKQEFNRSNFKLKIIQVSKYLSAACITLIMGVALWYAWQKDLAPIPQQSPLIAKSSPSTTWVQISNTQKVIQRIQLPDSSIVKLSPKSSLSYEKSFKHKFRDVFLTGKAYFKVKRNAARPFSVHAGGLKTTALGTSFTINTLKPGNRTYVVLHTGKIVVSETVGHAQPVYLSKAGNGILYHPGSPMAQLTNKKPNAKLLLEPSLKRQGTALIMKNIPLPQVISLLSDSYGVAITGINLQNITYTGTVDPSQEQIEEVLKVICLINNLSLSRGEAKEFIIQKSNQ